MDKSKSKKEISPEEMEAIKKKIPSEKKESFQKKIENIRSNKEIKK